MRDNRLPIEIKNALIDVCGRSFWYKQPLFDIFARAGISEEIYLRYEHEPKFKLARQVINDLEGMGEDGWILQRRLLTELCRLRTLPDSEVPDPDAGLKALRSLKVLAAEHDLVAEEEKERTKRRTGDSQTVVQKARERDRKLSELHAAFVGMVSSPDHQARGYSLEDLLNELFAVFELRYRKSYRTESEQIDGFFNFGAFDYLVEARWRKDPPTLGDLLEFKGKIDRKIESTRGLFISAVGFRPEIIQRLREAGTANLILLDGYDLTLILEGRVSLIDALQAKADKASQEGVLFYSLQSLFPMQ